MEEEGFVYYARTEPRCVDSPRALTAGEFSLTAFFLHNFGKAKIT